MDLRSDDSITMEEMRELWPQNADGFLCARLLRRFLITRMVETAVGAATLAETAQAEAGVNKAFAQLVKDFGALAAPAAQKEPRKPMAGLNRFNPPQPGDRPQTETSTKP